MDPSPLPPHERPRTRRTAERRPGPVKAVPVKVVGAGRDGACVFELVVARSREVLSTAYAVLSRLGLRLVHTEVRVSPQRIVQRLHVLEPDDSPLDSRRIDRALHALHATFRNALPMEHGAAHLA